VATDLTPFATVADLSAALGIAAPAPGSVAYLQMLDALSDASDELRDITGQSINYGTSTVKVVASPGGIVRLSAVPAVVVESVTVDGVAVDYEQLDSASLLVPTCNSALVSVTYTHGWYPVPGVLRKWCKVLAAASIAAAKTGNLGLAGGIASVAVDDGRVTWATGAGENGTGVAIPDAVAVKLRATYGSPSITLEHR
jgi:hypothetical protein